MRGVVLRIPNGIAVLCPQLGILDGNGLVDGRMAGDVGSVVRKRTESKGEFVCVMTLQQQFSDEVSAASVVHQIAEFNGAEGIIAEILNHGAAIGVTVCFRDLRFRQLRKSIEEERADFVRPDEIYDFLMRQNGVRKRSTSTQQRCQEKWDQAERKQAQIPGKAVANQL